MHPGQKLQAGRAGRLRGSARRFTARCSSADFTAAASIRLWTRRTAARSMTRSTPSGTCRFRRTSSATIAPRTANATRPCSRATRGSVAAPTAGLHFTPALDASLAARGVEIARNHAARRLRHVSAGPRRPHRGSPARGRALRRSPTAAAQAINRARDEGRRIVAVGTTTTRTLEAARAPRRRPSRRRDRRRRICSSTRDSPSESSTAC